MSSPAEPTKNLHSDLPSASSAQGLQDRKELSAMAFERTRMPMVVSDAKARDYPIVLANKAFLELTGYTAKEVIGRNCRFLQGPGSSPAAIAEIRAALANQQNADIELLNYKKDGTPFWNRLHLSPIHADDGTLLYVFGSQIDTTDYRKVKALEASEHRLLMEIDHRSKNVLAIVESIVRLSNAEDAAIYAASVQQRVHALAQAHNLLSENSWEEVALVDVIRKQIAPYGFLNATLDGSLTMVPALTVQPLSLVLHELAVNAVQHGPLSMGRGALRVHWRPEDKGFTLQWVEAGGGKPAVSERRGFGTMIIDALIERQLGGRVSRRVGDDVFEVDIKVPA